MIRQRYNNLTDYFLNLEENKTKQKITKLYFLLKILVLECFIGKFGKMAIFDLNDHVSYF